MSRKTLPLWMVLVPFFVSLAPMAGTTSGGGGLSSLKDNLDLPYDARGEGGDEEDPVPGRGGTFA